MPGNKFDAGVYNYTHINFALDLFKVTEYCEGVWFKNNFAKVFSACNYYVGVATTSNAVSFRSL